MQVIQLYIEGQKVDMFSDESVNITQTIQNVKDISKIFTDFSKTFTLPASKTNNKIFEHYYNFDIVNGFDARTKKNSYIELNYKPFRKGKIKLEGVDLKDNKPYAYRITFFGNTVDLKDLLGEDTLSSLDWLNNFNQTYSAAAIRTGLTTGYNKTVGGVTYNKAVVAPLITHTTRLYYDSADTGGTYPDPTGGNLYPHGSHHHGVYYEELKYALKIHIIVKAIEEAYGIQFSEDFFATDNSAYYDLYFWLHRKKGKSFDSSIVTYQVTNFPFLTDEMEEVACLPDKLLIFGSTRGVEYDLIITSTTTNPYTVIIKKDGLIFNQKTVTSGSTSLQGRLTNSTTGYTVFIQTNNAMTNVVADWQLQSIQYLEAYNYTTDQFNISLTQEFIITEQIPDIKVIDFLTGVFKMFNLTAYEEDGIIVVRTLDSFYSSSTTTWDITDYMDVETSNVDSALPYKRIDFKYENLDTKLSKQHEQVNLNGWGTVQYDAGDNFDAGGDIYSVVAPFEHMKYERLIDSTTETIKTPQVGWFVDDNNDPYYGKPLLTYAINVTGDSIRFLDTETGAGGTFTDITSYYIPSNSVALSPATSTDNIHFNLEVNEYTFGNDFTGTLFNNYYNTYISEVFNSKRRITKVKAFLPINFLINYSLADKIQIGDKVYIINSINSNLLNGESSLELLNVVSPITGGGEQPTLENAIVSTLAGSSTDTTFTMNGQVTFEGVEPYTERGFYWVQGSGSPIGGTQVIVSGSGTSAYSATVTGRPASTTFSFIAYAINNGVTIYGTPARQVTTTATLSTPTVVTNATTNVSYFLATFNGTIVDVGDPNYTEKGFVWVLGTGTPTTSNNKEIVSGTSAGSYSNTYSLPSDNQTYTVRAYAINTQGTAYGANNSFTTLELPRTASVTTLDATNVVETSARLNGNITDVGNPNYTSKGFYWKAGTTTPTASDNVVNVSGTSAGTYDSLISSLSDGSTYSFVAWVTNSQGTTTGVRKQFTTTSAPVSEYYSLTRCTDGATGFRSGQETFQINLSTNDRVSASGIFYVVTGTTNTPFNSVGTVTDENATGCPPAPPTEYPPSVSTLSADPVGTSTATMNGNITDVGLPAYTSGNKGFVWIQGTGDPLSGGTTVAVSGTGTGIFSHSLSGLSDGTQYTYRAYASNGIAPSPVYGDPSTLITNLIGYYTLTRCSDSATGFRTGQTIEQISLGTNDRVTALGVSYIVTGTTNNTGVTSVGTVTDTGLSGCPTNLPRTYNIEICSGGITSTVNYTSDGALANGSAYYDGTNCWEIQTVTTYNAGATSIDGTTIYNSCFACNNANPQLTAFFSTTVKSLGTVCNPDNPSEIYYHDGANPLPQVDDVCYTTSNGSTVLPAGYYAINDGFNFIDISNNNGIVDAVGVCID